MINGHILPEYYDGTYQKLKSIGIKEMALTIKEGLSNTHNYFVKESIG